MACTPNATGSGENGSCFDLLSLYNSWDYSGFYDSISYDSPEDFGCETFIYVGRYNRSHNIQIIKTNCVDDSNPGEEPEIGPEYVDDYITARFKTNMGAGYCSETDDDNDITIYAEHTTFTGEYFWEYREPGQNNCHYTLGAWVLYRSYDTYDDYYIVTEMDNVEPCVPGTEWNNLTGICEPLPGWEEDPDNPGNWTPIYCISVEKTEEYTHTDGNTEYIYVGRTWTYRAYIEYEHTFQEDLVVYLSYAGSGVTNGIEFDGPTYVIIPAGESSIDFEIKINEHENAYGKFLKIEGITELYDSCEIASNQILSKESTPVTEDSYCSNIFFWQEPTCADFFSSSDYYQFEIKRKG